MNCRLLFVLLCLAHHCLAQTSEIILENGSYFNGKSFVPFKEIRIADGKILSINNKISHKNNEIRIDAKGKFIIPGLVDGHVHLMGSPTKIYIKAEPKDNLKSALHCGVTTVIDLFSTEKADKEIRASSAGKPGEYASAIMSGRLITAPMGHGTEFGVQPHCVTSIDEAIAATNEVIDNGADIIKIVYDAYSNEHHLTKEILQKVVETAHKRGIKVFAHIGIATEAMDCIDAGVDVLAHLPLDSLSDGQLKKIKKSGIVIVPTITVYQAIFEGFGREYVSDSLLWKTANPDYLFGVRKDSMAACYPNDTFFQHYYHSIDFRNNLEKCIKMHIPILAGTDAGNYGTFFGYSVHNEILQYVKSGMTNVDALCSASEMIEKVFPDIHTGRIKEGYDADLIMLNTNPLDDISNTKDINMVIHKGVIVKGEQLFPPTSKSVAFDSTFLEIEHSGKISANIEPISDSVIGGTSTIAAKIESEPNADNFLHIVGKVNPTGSYVFAGVSFSLSANENDAVNLGGYRSISFDVKGNHNPYYLLFQSTKVKDYNYHGKGFFPGNEWKTLTIQFSELRQNPNYGEKIPLDLKTITAIEFEAFGKCDIDLRIKNIRLNR